jgi:V8-like Glu-specific endopeptidase
VTIEIEQVPTDPLNLGFKGADHKALADALEKAFPDFAKLNQMLTARLDQSLNSITAPGPMPDVTFEVVTFYKAKGHVLRLIAAARASQPDNPYLALVAEKFRLATQTQSAPQLEKIVKKTSVPFDVAVWRGRLARREKCICRIELPTNNGMAYGTGFLVGPDLILTNHHVMAPAIAGKDGKFTPGGLQADPKKVIVRFDYKVLEGQPLNPGVEVRLADDWLVDSSPHSVADTQPKPKQDTPTLDELDHALIRLAEAVGSEPIPLGNDTDKDAQPRGWVELSEAVWPFVDQSTLYILQHPQGEPMALAIDLEAKMELNANNTRVVHQTGTKPGSSGSPCFNQFWDLIALHHAGDPAYPDLHPGAFNEAVPIYQIVARLKRQNATDGLTLK